MTITPEQRAAAIEAASQSLRSIRIDLTASEQKVWGRGKGQVVVDDLIALGWGPRQGSAAIRAAAMEEAALVARKFQEPQDCVRRSPSGQCNISGNRDCLCQEREETAEAIEIAIRALATMPSEYVVVRKQTIVHWIEDKEPMAEAVFQLTEPYKEPAPSTLRWCVLENTTDARLQQSYQVTSASGEVRVRWRDVPTVFRCEEDWHE